jgi:hypothetical protein
LFRPLPNASQGEFFFSLADSLRSPPQQAGCSKVEFSLSNPVIEIGRGILKKSVAGQFYSSNEICYRRYSIPGCGHVVIAAGLTCFAICLTDPGGAARWRLSEHERITKYLSLDFTCDQSGNGRSPYFFALATADYASSKWRISSLYGRIKTPAAGVAIGPIATLGHPKTCMTAVGR